MDYLSILKHIWNDFLFQINNNYFCLANFNTFRIIDEVEFEKINSILNVNEQEKNFSKKVIAVADINGDEEHTAYLYIDINDLKIYYYGNLITNNPNGKYIRVTETLEEYFKSHKIIDSLVPKFDEDLWKWFEKCYYSTTIENDVPISVIPRIDLRIYVKSLNGSYVSSCEEFNLNSFKDYFAQFNLEKYIPDDFYTFSIDEKLKNLISNINSINFKNNFHIISFNISNFWAIINKENITNKEFTSLQQLGLVKE